MSDALGWDNLRELLYGDEFAGGVLILRFGEGGSRYGVELTPYDGGGGPWLGEGRTPDAATAAAVQEMRSAKVAGALGDRS